MLPVAVSPSGNWFVMFLTALLGAVLLLFIVELVRR
ncbi:MAG: GlsB/YeaQ/YmgE family stress response membrane protein [Rhodospirillales bacterium]|nr:GlsB/YeaQ/YmgE family stress response membrane protein [Acetobacter sp.]